QQQLPSPSIPESKGKHAAQVLHAVPSIFLIQMDDHLRIGGGIEGMPEVFQLGLKFSEVINFSVEYHPNRAILVVHRLVPGLQVDDAQAAHPKPHALTHIEALIVRAAVGERCTHRLQPIERDRLLIETHHSRNTAHRSETSSPRPATSRLALNTRLSGPRRDRARK